MIEHYQSCVYTLQVYLYVFIYVCVCARACVCVHVRVRIYLRVHVSKHYLCQFHCALLRLEVASPWEVLGQGDPRIFLLCFTLRHISSTEMTTKIISYQHCHTTQLPLSTQLQYVCSTYKNLHTHKHIYIPYMTNNTYIHNQYVH